MANVVNSVTGDVISKENLTLTEAGDAIINGDKVGSFTYVPGKDIMYTPAEKTISVDGPEKPLSYGSQADTIDNNSQELATRVVYDFGIDSVTARYTAAKPLSGFISQPVNIGNCSSITLSVKAAGELDGRTEFSIIDGATEVPILPEEMNAYIVKEKLFPGMQTRFPIDTSKSCFIYKDNAFTTLSYEDVQSMPMDDGEYSISYTSLAEHKYTPVNETVRLKVIARCSGDNPVPIKAMTIKRFGGETPWRISD